MRKLRDPLKLQDIVADLFELDCGDWLHVDTAFVFFMARRGRSENFNGAEAIRIRELAGRYLG